MTPFRVFIGFDPSQEMAYRVARHSLLRHASCPVVVEPLVYARLRRSGLFDRGIDRDGAQLRDAVTGAPMSTEFAFTRFLVPHLVQEGRALFVDCDVLFTGDVAELQRVPLNGRAVAVVKHEQPARDLRKMGGLQQTRYARKNWSSVMLFNCDHPAWSHVTLYLLHRADGLFLHGFKFLPDSEIGELPRRWNWLVGEQDRPEDVALVHYTLGGPWLSRSREVIDPAADELWLQELRRLGNAAA
jgi:lipopolysaccharide biosynthesis glycosyltransferase